MPKGSKRTRLKGTVTSEKTANTVIVTVTRRTQHPFYKKYINRRKKYAAHDEKNHCKHGDVVEIISSRPFSKTKTWAVTRILKAAQETPLVESQEKE